MQISGRMKLRHHHSKGDINRNLTTTSGDVTLKVPKFKGISFETAIIERYRRRESSVEEALIEMCVSVRRVKNNTEALWGSKVSPSTISELTKKAYVFAALVNPVYTKSSNVVTATVVVQYLHQQRGITQMA